MKNKNNQLIIITSILCLLPIVMSFIVYHDLPKQIAIHWDSEGIPDNYVPRAIAAFGLPFLFVAINIFSKRRLFNAPKEAGVSSAMRLFSVWAIPAIALIVMPITFFVAMNK